MGMVCTWCGVETAEKFCSEDCRENFDTACRIWGEEAFGSGEVSIWQLHRCLGRRARRTQRDLAPKGAQVASEAMKDSGGPLAVAVENATR